VTEKLNLSNLKPAQAKKSAKRVGRGLGSGKGRYSGRGLKGQKARSGSHKMRAGFEGGQMPLYMRLGKQRGSTSKDAMPVGPFRTRTYHVNLRDLEARFEAGAEVTPEALAEKGLIRNTRFDVKVLGQGDLSKKLTVTVHRASASAREKIEQAGGTLTLLREPVVKKKRRPKPKAKEAVEPEAETEVEPAAERPGRAKRGPVEGAPGEPGGSPADHEAAAPEAEAEPEE
jgi:large subunit ribosomal protein L15